MLLVDVLAVTDLELLAARKLDLVQVIVVDGLAIQLDVCTKRSAPVPSMVSVGSMTVASTSCFS